MSLALQNTDFCGVWYHSAVQLGEYGSFLFQNVSKSVVPKPSWDVMNAFWKAGTSASLPSNITFFVVKGRVFESDFTDWFFGKDFFGMGPFIGTVLFRSAGQPMSPTMQLFWQGIDQVCSDVGDTVSFFIVERVTTAASAEVSAKKERGKKAVQSVCTIL